MDIHEAIKESATLVANRHGSRAFDRLCEKWDLQPSPELRKVFCAGIASGVQIGMETVLKAGEEADDS